MADFCVDNTQQVEFDEKVVCGLWQCEALRASQKGYNNWFKHIYVWTIRVRFTWSVIHTWVHDTCNTLPELYDHLRCKVDMRLLHLRHVYEKTFSQFPTFHKQKVMTRSICCTWLCRYCCDIRITSKIAKNTGSTSNRRRSYISASGNAY